MLNGFFGPQKQFQDSLYGRENALENASSDKRIICNLCVENCVPSLLKFMWQVTLNQEQCVFCQKNARSRQIIQIVCHQTNVKWTSEICYLCKGVHYVDLGEGFQMSTTMFAL